MKHRVTQHDVHNITQYNSHAMSHTVHHCVSQYDIRKQRPTHTCRTICLCMQIRRLLLEDKVRMLMIKLITLIGSLRGGVVKSKSDL